jgi:uncharacterized protein (TIGR03086 family)
MKNEYAPPAVAYLAHESCSLNGETHINRGLGVFRLAMIQTRGFREWPYCPRRRSCESRRDHGYDQRSAEGFGETYPLECAIRKQLLCRASLLCASGVAVSTSLAPRATVATVRAVSCMGVDPLVAHERAQDTFAGVLVNVTPEQLPSPTPCPEWDVQALIDHVITGNQRVIVRAGGQVAPLPEGLSAAHRASASAAQEIFAAPRALTRTYQLPIGELRGTAFIEVRTSDLVVHAWDLAIATGQPTDLDWELAEYVLAFSKQMMSGPGLRGIGRPYGEEQPCGDERPAADRVAAFLGRKLR